VAGKNVQGFEKRLKRKFTKRSNARRAAFLVVWNDCVPSNSVERPRKSAFRPPAKGGQSHLPNLADRRRWRVALLRSGDTFLRFRDEADKPSTIAAS